jgi:alkanesulfonate monooxygenase SsuD/methylene tetrahydromethanopterin reductase-like flavin-dependent oxidoreductase (luciferase family)
MKTAVGHKLGYDAAWLPTSLSDTPYPSPMLMMAHMRRNILSGTSVLVLPWYTRRLAEEIASSQPDAGHTVGTAAAAKCGMHAYNIA